MFCFQNGHKCFDAINVCCCCCCLILLFVLTRFLSIGVFHECNASDVRSHIFGLPCFSLKFKLCFNCFALFLAAAILASSNWKAVFSPGRCNRILTFWFNFISKMYFWNRVFCSNANLVKYLVIVGLFFSCFCLFDCLLLSSSLVFYLMRRLKFFWSN